MSPETVDNHQLIVDTLTLTETRPVTAREISAILPLMRQELLDAGIKLGLSEFALNSLKQKQFQTRSTGRGPGMKEALGIPRTVALFEYCRARGVDSPKIKNGGDKSRGRGLRQLAADIILLLANPEPTPDEIENFTLRLNRRVKKGLIKAAEGDEAKEAVRQAFISVPNIADEKKWKEFASVPPRSVVDLYKFLTTLS